MTLGVSVAESRPLRVLLVEPWYSGSHRLWADGYAGASRHDVTLVTHPGRFWRWRLRGGAVTLAESVREAVRSNGPADVLLVSSGVDLAALTGLLRRELTGTAVVLYLHENQVVYPLADTGATDAAQRSWQSIVAADRVLINSAHHRLALARGLTELAHRAPDLAHGHLIDPLVDAMHVVPVGVDCAELRRGMPCSADGGPPVVIWNHRWDPDKHPEVFVRAVRRLAADGVPVRVVLAGEDGWDGASRRAEAVAALGDTVVASGPFDRSSYLSRLRAADVVVSVAEHDFFGVAVVEAMAVGCVPVLPLALSYPELVPAAHHQAVFHEPGGFRRRLAAVVEDLPAARAAVAGLDRAMDRFDWSSVAPLLDRHLEDAIGG